MSDEKVEAIRSFIESELPSAIQDIPVFQETSDTQFNLLINKKPIQLKIGMEFMMNNPPKKIIELLTKWQIVSELIKVADKNIFATSNGLQYFEKT